MIHTCPPALANMMTPAKGGTSWGFLPSALRIFLPPQQHLTILDPPLSVVNNFQATRDNKTQTLRVWSCLSPGSGRNGGRGRPGRTPTPALAPSGRCCCSARSRWSRSTRRSARTHGLNTASDRPGRRGPLQYRPGLLCKPFFLQQPFVVLLIVFERARRPRTRVVDLAPKNFVGSSKILILALLQGL